MQASLKGRAICCQGARSAAVTRATPARAAAGRQRVVVTRAQTIEHSYEDLVTPTGRMRTYIMKPTAPGKYPGIALFSEIFQVTGPIRRSAQIMAGHGFIVAIPEIYHEFEEAGVAFEYDTPTPKVNGVDRGNELKITKELAAYDSDSAAVVQFLIRHPDCTGNVGVMGFCIGGHLAFRAAMNRGVRAAACWYPTDIHKGSLAKGMNDDTLERIPELAAAGTEMLMIYGRQDPHVPYDGRVKTKAALEAAGAVYTWYEFNGQHAFMRDEGARYDAELALQCYRLAIDMFKRKLNEGDLPVPYGGRTGGGESKH